MPCLFNREFQDRGRFTLLESVSSGCEWVLAGEGVASRKWDGTAVMYDGERWYQRYDAKSGTPSPYCFIPCEPSRDPITSHWPGWTPVNMGNESAYIREAIENFAGPVEIGTYEACGPKINGNPEGLSKHELRLHGDVVLSVPRTFEGIRDWLDQNYIEGIVFSHEKFGRCKVRRADFGFAWGKHK